MLSLIYISADCINMYKIITSFALVLHVHTEFESMLWLQMPFIINYNDFNCVVNVIQYDHMLFLPLAIYLHTYKCVLIIPFLCFQKHKQWYIIDGIIVVIISFFNFLCIYYVINYAVVMINTKIAVSFLPSYYLSIISIIHGIKI